MTSLLFHTNLYHPLLHGEAAYQLKLDQLVQVKRAHRCVGAFNRAHSFTTSLQANDLDRFLTDPP